VKSSSRRVGRRPAGLIELSLAQAAINCATSEVTLKRRFSAHRIQPNERGRYLVADLLEAFGPNGDSASQRSLESHADLQRDRAELTRLEISERKQNLVQRGPILDFLAGLSKRLHQAIENFDLDAADKRRFHTELEEIGREFWESSGWPLLTLSELDEGFKEYRYLDSPKELWARATANRYAARSEQRRGTSDTDKEAAKARPD
jgi:hypothetical protein